MGVFQRYKIKSAKALLDKGYIEKAIEKFKNLNAADPDNTEILVGLSYAYLDKSATDTAFEYAQKAVSLDSTSVEAQICLAEILYSVEGISSERFKEVMETIKRLGPRGSIFASVIDLVANFRNHEFEEFEQIVDELRSNNGLKPRDYAKLHYVLDLQQRNELSREILEEALIYFPENAEILESLAHNYLKLGTENEAYSILTDVLKRNPDNYAARCHYGYLLRQKKNFKQAVTCYEDALALRPKSSFCWKNLATCLRKLERFDGGLEAAEKALSYAKSHTSKHWIYYEIAFCSWKLGNIERAEESFLKAIDEMPSEYWFHKNLSELYFENGNTEAGEKYLKISETLSMDNIRSKEVSALFNAGSFGSEN